LKIPTKITGLAQSANYLKRNPQQAAWDLLRIALRLIEHAEFPQLTARKLTFGHTINVTSINLVSVGAADHLFLCQIKSPRTIAFHKVVGERFHSAFKPAPIELSEQNWSIQPPLSQSSMLCLFVTPKLSRLRRNFTKQMRFRMNIA